MRAFPQSFRDKPVIVKLLIGGLVLGSLYLFAFQGWQELEPCRTEITGSRPITKSTITIRPLWSRSISISSIANNTHLVSMQNLLIADHYCPNPRIAKITAFAWTTGEIIWNSSIAATTNDFALDLLRGAVYISGTGRIQALSAKDGSALWTNSSSLFERTAHPLQVLPDGKVIVYVTGTIKLVESSDGVLQDFALPAATFLFDSETAYLWGPVEQNRFLYIEAVSAKNGQTK